MAARQAWSPWPDDSDRFLADADWHNLEDNWDFGMLDHESVVPFPYRVDTLVRKCITDSASSSNWNSSSHANEDFLDNNLSPPNALQTRPLSSHHSLLSSRPLSPSPYHAPAEILPTISGVTSSTLLQSSSTNVGSNTPEHTRTASRVNERPVSSGHHMSAVSPTSFGYLSDNLWNSSTTSAATPTHSGPLGTETNGHDMASSARSGRQTSHSRIVDLTGDTSPPSSQKRKRGSYSAASNDGRSPKRGQVRAVHVGEVIEAIDLSNDQEGSSPAESMLRSQQQAAIRSQQEASAGPQRVGKHTCIICMEPYTNVTTTVCGHLFCHECLTQALMAGEKSSESRVGSCPVCRKPLKRHTKTTTMVPILFMQQKPFTHGQEKTNLIHFQ